MITLTYISATNYDKKLFDYIKSDNFINAMGSLTQQESYDLIESKGIKTRGVYIMKQKFNGLTECVEYVKRNNHVFDRDGTVYYIYSEQIRQLNKPVMKHHTDRLKNIFYEKWEKKQRSG